jgi:AraC-like DNA-binding protein
VRFAHERPTDVRPFRNFFQVPLQFDADESALVFDEDWLDRRSPGADATLHQMMLKRVEELEAARGDDLVGQLRRMLPGLVADRRARLEVVGRLAGLSERTLARRLEEAGVSFLSLREEAYKSAAIQLLANTRFTAQAIADHLGYANPGSFTRAFRRWTGQSPARWRAAATKRR